MFQLTARIHLRVRLKLGQWDGWEELSLVPLFTPRLVSRGKLSVLISVIFSVHRLNVEVFHRITQVHYHFQKRQSFSGKDISANFNTQVEGCNVIIYLKVQDSLLDCIKTYEKTEQFVYEYMCIIHEKAAALPGIVAFVAGVLCRICVLLCRVVLFVTVFCFDTLSANRYDYKWRNKFKIDYGVKF